MPVILISFLCGFSVLLSEIAWARLLTLAFGSATSATTIVITTFMAGLGIGGLFWGRCADKTKDSIKLLILLLMGITFSSVILLFLFPEMPEIYKFIARNLNIGASGSLSLIFLLAFFLIFFPTFMMGGVFPILNRLYIRDENKIRQGVSLLYGVNTSGSVIGASLAGFFLIRNFGLFATQIAAILINLLMVVILFLFFGKKFEIPKPPNESRTERNVSLYSERLSRYLPLIAGITGFTGLAYEVLWIRALSVFLTNSTYVFTTILILILSGIFFGSLLLGRLKGREDLFVLFGLIQIAIGLYVIVMTLFLNDSPGILFSMREILKKPILYIILPSTILSLIIAFIPSILMGMSFPLLCTIYNRSVVSLGRGIGRIYFFNTTGSALGSLSAGFLLLSFLGVVKGLVFVALINLSLGILFTLLSRKRILFNLGLSLCALIIAIFATKQDMVLPPSIYRTPGRLDRILYYKETRDGTITINEDRATGVRTCYVNNSAVIGTTYDALKLVKLLGHLPFIYNPSAEDVLVIGFGVGITTSAIARYPVNQIDCIEICPGLKEASRYFAHLNDYVFNNPKVNFISQDGRNFLLLSNKRYDIISCDPVHPGLGSGNLYTQEYFLLCKRHLKEQGVVCQYLPLHKLSQEEFKSLIRTFADVFPDCSIWLGFSHGILVGTLQKKMVNFELLKNIKDEMLDDPYLLASSFILDRDNILKLTEGSSVHTDNRPFLEFFTPVSIKNENWELNIKSLFVHRSKSDRVIINIPDYERFHRYLLGQEYFINGLIYQNQGEKKRMLDEIKKAIKVNPENQEIELFLKSELKKP